MSFSDPIMVRDVGLGLGDSIRLQSMDSRARNISGAGTSESTERNELGARAGSDVMYSHSFDAWSGSGAV